MSPKRETQKPKGFTDEEKAARKEGAVVKGIHKIVRASAPALSPKTWSGMPGYAYKVGEVFARKELIDDEARIRAFMKKAVSGV